ncbi:hypothetical protein I6F35_05615 [Bradyrhizobium sp. BRP22]|uniref:hypothetical protein n=1 Tax=Bradyrhizobium sp. BRP22 TaxID=2793821 RepID=UPI001CD238DC|nr:hypothetical protein [Bradyrhizobium sp. BRP22]MCA1452696.1 hypothetical protein [Bradyrhizobium sp. BRP22]
MQANYRIIFREMLLAQSAAAGAFGHAAGRYAELMGQAYQEALMALVAEVQPKDGAFGPPHPADRAGNPAALGLINFCRAFAGLPRASMIGFLSRYDNLRGKRVMVQDRPGSTLS